MKIEPLKKYKKPFYPEKNTCANNLEWLESYTPQSWLKKNLLVTAVAVIGLGAQLFSMKPAEEPQNQTIDKNEKDKSLEKKNIRQEIKIAPLFIHGDGAGATGCVVVSPPAFLSEAEAMDIIISECKKTGLEFDEIAFKIIDDSFAQPKKDYSNYSEQKTLSKEISIVKEPRPFVFTLYNKKMNIGFKYITRSNYFDIHPTGWSSTVQDYDFVELASYLQENLKDYGECSAAIFYDPMADVDDSRSEKKEKSGPSSSELLKKQISDFLLWYKENLPLDNAMEEIK